MVYFNIFLFVTTLSPRRVYKISIRVLDGLKRGPARVPDPLVPLPHLHFSAPGSRSADRANPLRGRRGRILRIRRENTGA